MSVESKMFGLTPRHEELIEKIREKVPVTSDSEAVRRAIEHYAKEVGIDE